MLMHPRPTLGALVLSCFLTSPFLTLVDARASDVIEAEEVTGLWTGPTLHDLLQPIAQHDCGYVTWEFRADRVLVVDFLESFGYSWSAGSWDLWYSEEKGRNELSVELLGLFWAADMSGKVQSMLFVLERGADGKLDLHLERYALDGVEQAVDPAYADFQLCDRQDGPPPPAH